MHQITFDEYLDFLDEYWKIFGPIPEPEISFENEELFLL